MKIQTKSETKAKTAPGTGKVSEGTGMQQAPELVLGTCGVLSGAGPGVGV